MSSTLTLEERRTEHPSRAPWTRPRTGLGWVAVSCTALATIGFVAVGGGHRAGAQLGLAVAALTGFAALLALSRRRGVVSSRAVWCGSLVVLCVAVALPPQGSRDVWAYAMYGRMVAHHQVSPYHHVPAEYPSDPSLARMAPGWRHSRSVYGPLFTGVSAAGMAAAGDSALGGRLVFQGLAGLAVVASLLLVRRVRGDPAALAFVGLNPAVLAIVNGGHNDLLVGLAVLAGVVLVSRSARPWLIGAALAAGALIKIAALLPLAGVVAWLAWRRGWRAAAKVSAWSGGFIVAAYLLAGGWRAVAPLDRASGYESRVSIWRGHLLRHVLGRPGWWAITVVVMVALVVIAGRLADLDPATAAGGAALVYLLAAPYVLPWYAGWALPVLALAWPRRLTVLALVDASVLLVIYVDRGGLAPAALHQALQVMAGWVVPALELAALAGLAVVSVHRASALVAKKSAGRSAGRSAAAP